MLVDRRHIIHDIIPIGSFIINQIVYIQSLLDANALRLPKSCLKVFSRVILGPKRLVVDLVRHERVQESAEGQTIIPTAAEVFYFNILIVDHPLLAPFYQGVSLTNAILLDQIG